MKYWEFLIQKEGDIDWLPIETRQVRLLEGRYRVVAHTSRANTPTDIQVSQLGTTDLSPPKRVRTCTSQTNDAGLLAVIPYVHFKPGQWELTCSRCKSLDGLDDWQYSLQIQVLSSTTEASWSSDRLIEANAKPGVVDRAFLSNTSATVDLDLLLANAQRQFRAQSLHTSFDTEEAYEVFLRQRAFLAQDDRPITVSGQVRSLSNLSVEQGESQLCLQLREPNTGQILMEAHRPVNLARLPVEFEITFQLPVRMTSRIVLGKVSLHSVSPKIKTSGTMLSSTAFTVTAGIARLLDDIADRESTSADLADCDDAASISRPQKNADYADEEDWLPLVASPPSINHHNVSPAVGVVLPIHSDQLAYTNLPDWLDLPSLLPSNLLLVSDSPESHSHQDGHFTEPESLDTVASGPNETELNSDEITSPNELTLNGSDLESSALPRSVQLPPMVTKPAQFIGTSIVDDAFETAQIAALLEDIDNNIETVVPQSNVSSLPSTNFLSTTLDRSESSDELIDKVESPSTDSDTAHSKQTQARETAKAAFKSLNLKEHFMQRLSNLTRDGISQSTKSIELHTTGGNLEHTTSVNLESPQMSPQMSEQMSEQSDTLADSEAVIFDEQSAVVEDVATPPTVSTTVSTTSSLTPSMEAIAEELPEMVLPIISVLAGDLTAGDRVRITVRTRPSVFEPCIKLWMIDRQSRTLIGEPKLLANLEPNALGDLQTSAELLVPTGCQEVQIAAIAINMATQQESNKAVVNRRVISPLHSFEDIPRKSLL